ncbi:MAG TPA: (Fe-S)-binding protein, partial [Deltaproteobacteria bacterium]|nr:(Fe-S)-binding protein [Deltaproteobacteria bacterium]
AVKHVQKKHDVNTLACICAIDRAALPPLMDYWAPEVAVTGVHELLGNALVMKGEIPRTLDLRGEELPNETDNE